jgi:site-specific DNA-methyltransferase (adenine-specific)
MEGMKEFPDKYFELAIVDPPYGIGRSGKPKSTSSHGGHKGYEDKLWDVNTPSKEYFLELKRVSKNQIIWGANYFAQYLNPSTCWLIWDKGQKIDQADAELAYTSFDSPIRMIMINRVQLMIDGTIHPTQKPIKLYKWLLKNYAKEGDKILDSHVGSGSSRIAAFDYGFEYVGYELITDYFNAQEKRFNNHKSQLKLFI